MEGADRTAAVGVDLPADARNEVDDMAVILHVAEEVHLHAVGALRLRSLRARSTSTRALGVLSLGRKKPFGPLAVQREFPERKSRARDVIDSGAAVLDLAVRLGRGAEDAEAPEIEIEEVEGEGLMLPQRTIVS